MRHIPALALRGDVPPMIRPQLSPRALPRLEPIDENPRTEPPRQDPIFGIPTPREP